MRDFRRLDEFIDGLTGDIYPEPPSEPHVSITRGMIRQLVENGRIAAGHKVLDIGCGQGLALEEFRTRGIDATGITLGPDDLRACRDKGFEVAAMDQSFLDFEDAAFDAIWCRHALEHSLFPLYTLKEFARVLRPAGIIYVEVPAPDTVCHHETNPNHYSVFGKSMWLSLYGRAGFDLLGAMDINFTCGLGPDVYWAFVLRKRAS